MYKNDRESPIKICTKNDRESPIKITVPPATNRLNKITETKIK